MKKTDRRLLFILLIIFLLNASFSIKDDYWKLVKDEDGIKAYTREVKDSDIKQVKVKTTLKSSLSAVVAIVKDVSSHKRWIYRCKTAKSIKEINESDYYYYNEAEAPWPVSNRDIITHAIITQDKNTKKVTIASTGLPNFIRPIEGIVRIERLEAKWEFMPKPGGMVDLSFYMLIDLGGTLPAWAVNMAIADGPFETVLNLRKVVKEEKYQNMVYDFIEEL